MEGAARRIPRPFGPTERISEAKIGRRAVAPPKRTANKSRVIEPSTIFLLKTNFIPPVNFSKTDWDFIEDSSMGFGEMSVINIIAKNMKVIMVR